MRKILPLAALGVLAALLLPATPALATVYTPDLFIKNRQNDTFHGQNYYTPTDPLRLQTARGVVNGGFAIFKIELQNDSLYDAVVYLIDGCDGNARFGVRYMDEDGNVSPEVKDGTFESPMKDSGQTTTLLLLRIKAKSAADHGDKFRCKVTATPDGDPTPGEIDTNRAKVRVV